VIHHPRVLLALIALSLVACGGDARLPELQLSGDALGTRYNITLIAPPAELQENKLGKQIVDTLKRIDELASTWRDDSQLSLFNANPSAGWINVSAELCSAIESSLEISRLSNGAFDITVGPLVNLWGFGPTGDLVEPPDQDAVDAAMQDVGYQQLQTDCKKPALHKQRPGLYVDLSGWAKGLAVDEVALLLKRSGLENYMVEIGGELTVSGFNAERKNWAIAIETPSTIMRRPHSVLRLTNTSVATSGDYRNYFEHNGVRYSHTIDARTGRPVSHELAAVTVVDQSAAWADAMATALLVLGPEAGPALAENLGVAGYFLVRESGGFEELATSSFEKLRNL
jgi:thiamine biosynthesis lipoprotein